MRPPERSCAFRVQSSPRPTHASERVLFFIPMVVEAQGGGWGAAGRSVIGAVARCVAAARSVELVAASLDIAQHISIALHRENARAILERRMAAG